MVEIVRQPEGSSLCGQCAVAMLTATSLNYVIQIVGHRHNTKTRELAKAMRHLGCDCGNRLRVFGKRWPALLPKYALVKIDYGRSSWHWVAAIDKMIYDPSLGIYEPDLYEHPIFGRPTSFLEVETCF